MKNSKFLILNIAVLGLFLSSCNDDFLTTSSITADQMGIKPITAQSVNENLASAYHILLRDNYADGYNDLWLISDLRSDDIFRGGAGASDQPSLYYLAQFTSTPSGVINGIYQLYWRGIARCNETVANADLFSGSGSDADLVKQYKAEAIFLRAFYHHVLWKNWGNIPYLDAPLTEPFVAPQLTADEVYKKLMEDIKRCKDLNILQMKSKDVARVNLAALYMLKADIVMYQKGDKKIYDEVAEEMAEIINSKIYNLFTNFDAMWLDENEFCVESIFESNQGGGGMDWSIGAGNPWGFGTNLPRFIGPNDLSSETPGYNGGWGFGPVRPHLYAIAGSGALVGQDPIFEAADVRREASILKWTPTDDDPAPGEYKPRTHDTGLFLKKYAARKGYNPNHGDLGYINNKRIYRYAETLLNYAELVGVLGASAAPGLSAQSCLDQVRTRAGVGSIPVNATNIELERRREFIGEGKRYWDLVRWGKAQTALTENLTWLSPLGNTETWNRTWDPAKSKYLPFPEAEITGTAGTAFPLKQNPY